MKKIKTLWKKDTYFRAGAGVVLLNDQDQVAMFERKDLPGEFQFSQGGLDMDEDPHDGALRELYEETGLTNKDVTIFDEHPHWLSYEANPNKPKTENYRGQTQKWFYAYLRPDVEIDLSQAIDDEFISQKWISTEEAVHETVSFKRHMYREIINYLNKNHLDPK